MATKPEWTPLRRLRSHEHVIAEIEKQILAGRLRVGDQLPAERNLAELLGVSRTAVREGFRALEVLGILDAHTGSGDNAGSTLVGRPSEAITLLLRLHMALSGFDVEDIVETRIVLEGWAARAAAEHRDPGDFTELEKTLTAMDDQTLTPSEFLELDTQFHVGIAEASGNRLINYLMQSLRDTMRNHMEEAFDTQPSAETVIATLRSEHREIYEQIRAGDGETAATHIEQHIRAFYAQRFSSNQPDDRHQVR